MSVARHHAEWLSLVEVSGPFVSMPVLQRVFPQGLDDLPTSQRQDFREAYDEWLEQGGKKSAAHQAWVRYVLTNLLGYPADLLAEGQALPPGLEATMAIYGERLRPDFALKHLDAGCRPMLLISVYPPEQGLSKPVFGKLWKATPGTRMMELLHATDIPVGLVTNGEHWMLVNAPRGDTTGFASWYADLWTQEPITLRAFVSLLHLRRFFGVAAGDMLAAMLKDSAKDQQDVTDQLGYQVRQAVEVLVQAFDRVDAEAGRTILAGVEEKTLYDAALTVMMRLVFMFAAEERGMLLLGQNSFYEENYALSTLQDELREHADQHGEEVLERRHDAWCRLLATFRAVHGGVEHESMRLPAYGGTLFDPDRFPFLEGRAAKTKWSVTPAKPLGINNRMVLHLLEALQILRVKVPGGGSTEARRLSFRALGIEQIGHVYEGLLDHTAKRAMEVYLGLAGAKNKGAEIPLSRMEDLRAKGANSLVEFLREETGRSEKALAKAVGNPDLVEEHRLLIACGQDACISKRVTPFAGLLREDSFSQLVVIPEGSVYVTAGSDRRSTGTHHTPRVLSEPLVQHTLEPLVYIGPSEGLPQEQWQLKSPREILALKVCDLAMGCGTLLVAVCRYLGERLVEAWESVEKANPGKILATPEGDVSEGVPTERLIPDDPDERLAIARRYVADRCLYGVDINPMAVEMAKLSLWLVTLQKDRPFTFLDHAFKCGDSLLGVCSVQQIENFSLRPGERQITFATANLFRYVDEASAKRHALEDLPSNDHTQIETKSRLHAEAEAATVKVKAIADCLIAFELRGLSGDAYEDQRTAEAEKVQLLIKCDADTSLKAQTPTTNQISAHARERLRGRSPFHWSVEFPEVFARGGFDAFVGNPPFIGGHDISGLFGYDYRAWLATHLFGQKAGLADICAFFAFRGHALTRIGGTIGLVATNSITEGDSKRVGLDQIIAAGSCIYEAWPDMPWPGNAAVVISPFMVFRGKWNKPTFSSTLSLTAQLEPHSLANNQNICFVGCYVLGDYFELDEATAKRLLSDNPQAQDVILPYINGVELNAFSDMRPRRWIICFWDWNQQTACSYKRVFEHLKSSYEEMKAATKSDDGQRSWWLYARSRPALYHAIGLGHRFAEHPVEWKHEQKWPVDVIVKAKTSETWAFAFIASNTILDQALTVFSSDDRGLFAVLQSTIHEVWTRDSGAGSKMKTDLRYAPTSFEAFPIPEINNNLVNLGESYDVFRSTLMIHRVEGLTDTYNRFHDRGDQLADIARLRALHGEMDQAVAAAYGWSDLDLGHGFHETKQGVRHTISEAARRIVLDRLLALNHQRYEEEVKAGLHDKKKPKSKKNNQQADDNREMLLTGF